MYKNIKFYENFTQSLTQASACTCVKPLCLADTEISLLHLNLTFLFDI